MFFIFLKKSENYSSSNFFSKSKYLKECHIFLEMHIIYSTTTVLEMCSSYLCRYMRSYEGRYLLYVYMFILNEMYEGNTCTSVSLLNFGEFPNLFLFPEFFFFVHTNFTQRQLAIIISTIVTFSFLHPLIKLLLITHPMRHVHLFILRFVTKRRTLVFFFF